MSRPMQIHASARKAHSMRNAYRLRLLPGRAIHLGHAAGELRVLEGQVWLTHDGDPEDHFITSGRPLQLAANHGAVVEIGRRDEAVVLWKPEARWAARAATACLHFAADLAIRAGLHLRRAARMRAMTLRGHLASRAEAAHGL